MEWGTAPTMLMDRGRKNRQVRDIAAELTLFDRRSFSFPFSLFQTCAAVTSDVSLTLVSL